MAPKTLILLYALLGAVFCMQAVVATESAPVGAGTTLTAAESNFVADEEQSYVFTEEEQTYEVAESDVDSFNTDVEPASAGEEYSPAHPLSRILHERSSKHCWNKKSCKKFFKKPGCCKKKCVNLAKDNKHCGKCGKCCDTKRGFRCVSGKCKKPHKKHRHPKPSPPKSSPPKASPPKSSPPKSSPPRPHHPQCGHYKKCKHGWTCCKGKCVNLKTNKGHCGKCNKGCGYGSECCKGKCKNLKHDIRNCGKCGKSCGWGRKCCHGYCKNIFGSDNHHCGACGKKCATKCTHGMCGYGQ